MQPKPLIILMKNVPITPPARERVEKDGKHQFKRYKVGDSAFYSSKFFRTNSVMTCASRYGTKWGKKFITRKVTEDGVKGVRVWRIE